MMERILQPAFCVVGREGATWDGPDFIPRLWQEANARFAEASALEAQPLTLWGGMSACDHSFAPWEENFSRGLYLAGFEALPGAQPPAGWVRWDFPGFEALSVPEGDGAFAAGLAYLKEHGLSLAMAVQERTDPANGKTQLLFPIRRL